MLNKRIGLLFLLYLSQGLPFGFQITALPVYLRSQNTSLTLIGFSSALALPWMLKALWSPLVDRFSIRKIGRRKTWIIPLQILLLGTILFTATLSPEKNLTAILAAVFFMNLFAATQDIAVDGLAVDILGTNELGPGNAAQVCGYKTGMLISGGLLVWLGGSLGWTGMFLVMGIFVTLPLFAIMFYREQDKERFTKPMDMGKTMDLVVKTFKLPGAGRLILFIASYKFGEMMVDVMFKPFLIDNGFTPSQIGLWLGTWGMIASLSGSLFGGFLAGSYSIRRMLLISAVARTLSMALEWAISLGVPTEFQVISVTVLEHFTGGMLTTVMFAFMMSRVNRKIGATHYTILATVEVLGKSPGGWISGPIAESFGYPLLFAAGTLLSLLPLLLLPTSEPNRNCLKGVKRI